MSVENNIYLPVSLGEAIDKLTILHIKTEKIKNNDSNDAKKEYNMLYEILKTYVDKYRYYYQLLKNVNLKIWEAQDTFRYSSNEDEKTELCTKIIIDNDSRFRIKRKINNICKSLIKEIKGYKLRKAFVFTHLGLGDNITSIGIVRYLSTLYDEVLVVCKRHNIRNLELIYSDDSTIKLYPTDNYNTIHPLTQKENFNKLTDGMDTYVCGCLVDKKIYNIPFSFYDDVKIDPSVFWEYFYIPETSNSIKLYELVKDTEYVFIHNTSSTGQVFSIEYVEKKLNIDRNKILFINPCQNIYDKDHSYYELANNFMGYLLADYAKIIINSKYIFLTDSSFFSMAINLEIKTDHCFVKARNNRTYNYLYAEKYIYKNNIKRKKFISI